VPFLLGCGQCETGIVAGNEAVHRGSEEADLMSWKRVVRVALASACVGGLAACAIDALKYTAPTDDQAAEFVVSTDGPMALAFYREASRCTDALQVPQPKVGSTSYRIPADREFAFEFFYYGGPYHLWEACSEQILSFHPEKGKQYRFHYALDRDRGECRWSLTENDDGRETQVQATEREYDPNFTTLAGEGLWCKPKGN
jgi:hypothetical protein